MFIAALFINSQKVETTQMSFSWWKDKQNVVYPHNGKLFSQKKEWSTDTCYYMDEPWRHYASEKSVTEDHLLYDSIYIKCLEEANL